MIVDIDAGNTRIKWRVAGENTVYFQPTESADASTCVPEALSALPVTRVRVACVAGEAVLEALSQQVLRCWGVRLEVAVVARGVGGIEPAYQDLSRLGVDRWLLMLAAYRQCQDACLVVSAGSALTADWLDAAGRHLGGYIAPGRKKMAHVLKWEVADVLRDDLNALQLSLAPGASTEQCVAAGINAAAKGFIAEALARSEGIPVWVAGGDAQAIVALCGQSHKKYIRCCEYLVLDGLAIALP